MWTIQRVGWALLAVVVVAALLGLLGGGPLSSASARASDDIEVHYGRIERHRSPSTVTVWVSTAVAEDGTVELWLDRRFADRLGIEAVTPDPESVKTSATRVTYTFEIDEAERRARITYNVVHQGIGLERGQMGIEDGRSVSFRQLVLP